MELLQRNTDIALANLLPDQIEVGNQLEKLAASTQTFPSLLFLVNKINEAGNVIKFFRKVVNHQQTNTNAIKTVNKNISI